MPVLLSGKHKHIEHFSQSPTVSSKEEACQGAVGERVLQCMKWGLVPSWHKGDPLKFGTLLNNCRLDSIEFGAEKPSFRGALHRGQRCVVVADGFYEWQTTKPGLKQPYFIHFADNKPTAETQEVLAEQGVEFKGIDNPPPNEGRMLTMAGLFDIWRPPHEDDGDVLFTFTVITVNAHPKFAHIHDRMPALLDGQNAIAQWLDFENVPTHKALKLLEPADCLQWYPVSTVVNSIKHKSPECMRKIDPELEVNSKQKTLKSWFTPMKTAAAPLDGSASESKPPEKKSKV